MQKCGQQFRFLLLQNKRTKNHCSKFELLEIKELQLLFEISSFAFRFRKEAFFFMGATQKFWMTLTDMAQSQEKQTSLSRS